MSGAIVDQVLKMSTADAAVVIVTESSTVNLRWANSTLTTNGSTRDRSVTVISIAGKAVGVRSGTSFTAESLQALVEGSESDARNGEDASDYQDLISGSSDADFNEPAALTSTAVFEQFAIDLGAAFASCRADGIDLFGFANHDVTTLWMGNSKGLRKRHVQPTGSVDWTAKNQQPRGSVWFGQATRHFDDVSVPDTITELRKRLGWTANVIDLPAGRYETILPPTAVADLLIYSYWSSTGRDAAEGQTAFSKPGGQTRVGDRLGASDLQVFSDSEDVGLPAMPFVVTSASTSSSSVFDNGLSLAKTSWVKDGLLSALIETRTTAGERGVAVTPNVNNLVLETSGTKSIDEMISSTKRGLLVTCLWYIREVDPQRLLLTGLTRDGVYLVEDGEVKGVVNNFRWNESPLELLHRVSESGASVPALPREWGDYFTLVRMPPLRIPDFNMSTVSPAS